MKSFSVVEDLDVIEDGLPDLSGRQIFSEIDFGFQCSEERFSNCVIEAVTFFAHALSELVSPEHASEF